MLSKYTLEELIKERYRLTIKQSQINHNLRMVESAIELKQMKDERQHKLFEDEQ
jgi:hypothetical protein